MDNTTLIQTKLIPPRTSPMSVDRPRLREKLDLGLSCKLNLVSAPAGYGKTTLVSAWLQSVRRPMAWISLDANDDDLLLFLQYMVAAIQGVFPTACAETTQLIQLRHLPPPSVLHAQLINDIAAIPDNFILALDDYHLIHDVAILNLMVDLVENQPPNLHLLIITRKDPFLPLPRLRARNEISEIRQLNLRFREDEAEIFLRQTLHIQTETETAVSLNKQTEGWAVGLQLAGLFLRESKESFVLPETAVGGADTFANKYLVSEVLAHQPEEIRTYILACAILDRMCDSLCQAVTQIGLDKAVDLERVEAANLFLVALDNQGEWYRFHHLFHDSLQRQLHEEYATNEIIMLHQRASQWFADHGYIDEAIQHALQADDTETAVNILEVNGKNLLNTLDRYTLDRWLSKLPEEIIWQRPRLIIAKAWLLFREFRLTALDVTLDVVEQALESEEALAGKQALQSQVAALRAFTAAFLQNDNQRAIQLAEKTLLVPESARDARSVAIASWALAQHALGNEDTTIQALQKIIQHPAQPALSRVQAFIALSFLRHKAAQLKQMSQVVEQFLMLATKGSNPNAISGANMFAGILSYERNDLQQAATYFSVTYGNRNKANFMTEFISGLNLARIHLAQGNTDKAQVVLDELRADTLHLENVDLLGPLNSFQAALWLENGDLIQAQRWAHAVDVSKIYESVFFSEVASLTYSRILIREGSTAEMMRVVELLQSKLARAKAEHHNLRVIQINIHLALAQQKLDLQKDALLSLEEAVRLAQTGGLIRTFVDAGAEQRPLLEKLLAQNSAPHYIPQILAAFPDATPESELPSLATATLLTSREIEILQLMDERLTNQEIGEKLVISPHTVKRHASNIYDKLEVNGRRSAIFRAKELNIF